MLFLFDLFTCAETSSTKSKFLVSRVFVSRQKPLRRMDIQEISPSVEPHVSAVTSSPHPKIQKIEEISSSPSRLVI